MRDRLTALWYRLTYCTRHGHYKVHDGRCLNCGTTVTSPAVGRVCPECQQGKCGNCDGTAWDDVADAPGTCVCPDGSHR